MIHIKGFRAWVSKYDTALRRLRSGGYAGQSSPAL